METTIRPEICSNAMLDYLDELRESGVTNMFGAGEYLDSEFPWLRENFLGRHSSPNARQVLSYWMKTFSERHGTEGIHKI